MDNFFKQDLKISFLVGIVAGFLFWLVLKNIGLLTGSAAGAAAVLSLAVITPLGYLVGYWLSRRWPVMLQFVKFGIVGGLNFLVDLGILNLLIFLTGITAGFYYSVFKASSFIVAVINSYFWNKYWTFHAGNGPRTVEFIKFFTVNLIGFGINVSTASFVVNTVGAPVGVSGELWANAGAATAAIVALFWNFIGMKFIVFKK